MIFYRIEIEAFHVDDFAVERLVEWNRVSEPIEGYIQNTQNVAALERVGDENLTVGRVSGCRRRSHFSV